MTPGTVGRRYGRALFELATETGVVEDTGAGLVEFSRAIESLPAGSLAPGQLSVSQRASLATAMAEGIGRNSLLGRFVGVLAQNDRLEQLPAVQSRFEHLQDAAAGRVRVVVRTATALSSEQRESLKQRLETIVGGTVVESVVVDDGLLGGLSVEARGRVYDGSIRTQLARLERRMAG
jgi:F-type H+-transporting ATPase subunit delta